MGMLLTRVCLHCCSAGTFVSNRSALFDLWGFRGLSTYLLSHIWLEDAMGQLKDDSI